MREKRIMGFTLAGTRWLDRYTGSRSALPCRHRKAAFTLAEVLITLAIVGVVAALTIPTLMALINDKVSANRKEVIEDRLIQGLNQLNTLDDGMNASQYESTEDFVRALSKYYKMSQICGAEEMTKCFPYATITYTDDEGEAIANVEDLKTPEAFKLSSDEYLAPASFISAQGAPFVMLLKKDCVMDTGTAMRGIPTSCIQYMYDNNGSNLPNKLGKDIQQSTPIGIASIAGDDGGGASKVDPDGTLVNPIGEYKTYLILDTNYQGGDGSTNGINTCDGSDDIAWDNRGSSNKYCSNNKWAAAKKACSEAGYELPSIYDLGNVYCRVLGESTYTVYVSNTRKTFGCTSSAIDNTLLTKLREKSSPSGSFWSSSPDAYYSAYSYYMILNNGIGNGSKLSVSYRVLCLGK